MRRFNILESDVRVAAPFIEVKIGEYIFGTYSEQFASNIKRKDIDTYTLKRFPNYIQGLQVTKVNGQVNTYSLRIDYPITKGNDPNFFEKVFSSVSNNREIIFSYGDSNSPNFIYRQEKALITTVNQTMNFTSSVISYTIEAVSSGKLLTASAYNFPAVRNIRPSHLIKKLVKENKYGLQDIFTGMRDFDLVESRGLIAGGDKIKNIDAKTNIDIISYLKYLVMLMESEDNSKGLYIFTMVDDINGDFNGPYFQIYSSTAISKSVDNYVLNVGYPFNENPLRSSVPFQNVITSFNINNNETYSILYNYSKKLNDIEYISRIDDDGNLVELYSPVIYSNNLSGVADTYDKNWWKNMTEYPLTATITLKGFLKPALLMGKIELNVLFYGNSHISSGVYIITEQVDNLGYDGFFTTLKLVRVGSPSNIYHLNKTNQKIG